jgi:hypothetical protein
MQLRINPAEVAKTGGRGEQAASWRVAFMEVRGQRTGVPTRPVLRLKRSLA